MCVGVHMEGTKGHQGLLYNSPSIPWGQGLSLNLEFMFPLLDLRDSPASTQLRAGLTSSWYVLDIQFAMWALDSWSP